MSKGKSREGEQIFEMANPKTLARVHSRGIWEQAEFQKLSKLNFKSLAGVHSRGIKIVFTLAGFTFNHY